MMKKLFLLSALSTVVVGSAEAQMAERSIVSSQRNTVTQTTPRNTNTLPVSAASGIISKEEPTTPAPKPSAKPTAGGSRWYSYVEFLTKKKATMLDSSNIPYMWGKADAKGIYSEAGGGLVADTITLSSMGITFDPAFSKTSGFNESAIYDKTSIAVTRTDSYVVDSVNIFTTYGRNSTKTSYVDTLRVVIVNSNTTGASTNDLTGIIYTGSGIKPTWGVDTLRILALKWDPARFTATGTTRVVKDILLKNTDTASFVRAYGVPVGMTVPAGNIVGVSATFLSGHPYTPNVDTAFYGSLRPSEPFGMGMIRPRFFADATNPLEPAVPNYEPGYHNGGFTKFIPQLFETAFYADKYIPTYVYVEEFDLELPDIDVKVSCATCKTIQEVSVKEQTAVVGSVNAYPNPSNGEIYIHFTAKEKATATVSLSNMMGQVIATQEMGNLFAGQGSVATFKTSNLASGVYFYTIEANGQRLTNRFTVAH